MTLGNPVRSHSRPLRFVAISSALAFALSLGASSATLAAGGHDYGKYKKGKHSDRHRDDHRYDRGRGGHDDSDRYHRDPGYRYDGYRNDYRESYRGGGYYDRGYDHGRFVVPHHIYRDRYRDYDPYYRGAVYYAPHRHQHRVYLFPVIINGYAEYRPYAYCGEAYYPGHYYDGYGYERGGGHLGLHFSF